MENDRMVRIKDIALKAGVSSSTVSRVLNNDDTLSVTDEVRERVLQVTKELNYKPVQTRRNIQKKNNLLKKIGIMLCQSLDEELNDPYFLSIRQGIENECNNQGLKNSELFRFHHFNPDKINSDNMDGLIVVGKVNELDIAKCNLDKDRIVYIDYSPDESKYDSIV